MISRIIICCISLFLLGLVVAFYVFSFNERTTYYLIIVYTYLAFFDLDILIHTFEVSDSRKSVTIAKSLFDKQNLCIERS